MRKIVKNLIVAGLILVFAGCQSIAAHQAQQQYEETIHICRCNLHMDDQI